MTGRGRFDADPGRRYDTAGGMKGEAMKESDKYRRAIRTCGIPQREIARRAGVPLSCITYFLGGKAITTDTLDAILRVILKESKKSFRA
jgi:predicted transcriptional regulator